MGIQAQAAGVRADFLWRERVLCAAHGLYAHGPIPRAGRELGLDGRAPNGLSEKVEFLCRDAARDVAALSPHYALASATPVDMFPWTANVETVVLLSKGEIDSKKCEWSSR